MIEEDPALAPLFVRIPASLRKRVRQEAANEDLSMQQVVVHALQVYFQMPKGAAPKMKKRRKHE